jgi:hypothetical protein
MSDTEPVVAVVARSDVSKWENIVNFTRPGEAVEPSQNLISGLITLFVVTTA